MWTHEVKLEKYEATTPGGGPLQLGTAESQGNEFLHIKAGEGWEGLAIKVVFRPCKVSRMVPEDGLVDVPWEATKDPLTASKGRIVFRGLDESGRVMNSLDLPYAVQGHSPTGDRDESKYTPGAVDQIIAETKADAAAADLSAKAAAAAQKAAETSATAALQSAKDSAGSALRASHAADAAEKSRLAAAGSADAAAGSAQQAADAVQRVKEAGQQATEDVGTAQTNAVQAVQKAQTAAVQAVQGQQQTSVGVVQAAGTEAVGQVTQASQQQILAVEKAGKTQIDNVAEAGSARIEAVEKALEQAGQTQTDRVNKAGEDKLAQIDAVNAHPPIVQGGTWWTWDTASGAYTDTGLTAEGKDGNVLFATFAVDPATGLLSMTTPDGYAGPEFALNNGYLEVTVNV